MDKKYYNSFELVDLYDAVNYDANPSRERDEEPEIVGGWVSFIPCGGYFHPYK